MGELISVIVPVYNSENELERCLRSILDSTYKDIEVICIDDGSTDGSLNILNLFQKADSRVRVIVQNNKGVSAARNIGIKESKGKWISFVDSDDVIHKQLFEILLHEACKKNAELIICKYATEIPSQKDELYDILRQKSISLEKDLLFKNAAAKSYVWGRLYKRSIIGKYTFCNDLSFSEDKAFNLKILIAKAFVRVFYVDSVLYYHVIRQESLTQKVTLEDYKKLARWYYCTMKKDESNNKYCFKEAIQSALNYRFIEKVYCGKNSLDSKRTVILCLREGKKVKELLLRERILYWVLCRFDFFYFVIRVIKDPTIIKWAILEKEKRRNEKSG